MIEVEFRGGVVDGALMPLDVDVPPEAFPARIIVASQWVGDMFVATIHWMSHHTPEGSELWTYCRRAGEGKFRQVFEFMG